MLTGSKIKVAVEARCAPGPSRLLHSDLHSATYIRVLKLGPTACSGTVMQQHDALLQKWLSQEDVQTYKAELGLFFTFFHASDHVLVVHMFCRRY